MAVRVRNMVAGQPLAAWAKKGTCRRTQHGKGREENMQTGAARAGRGTCMRMQHRQGRGHVGGRSTGKKREHASTRSTSREGRNMQTRAARERKGTCTHTRHGKGRGHAGDAPITGKKREHASARSTGRGKGLVQAQHTVCGGPSSTCSARRWCSARRQLFSLAS